MSVLLKNLDNKLSLLKSSNKLIAIKAEFEAEGTRIEELSIISYLCSKNTIPLTLKIGGPCAKRDIYEAFQIGADNILIPMIESDFSLEYCVNCFKALKSTFKSFNESPTLSINIESITGFENIDLIIKKLKDLSQPLKSIVIGRSDLACSMGIDDVNDQKVFKISKEITQKCLKNNINITIGGNLSSNSYKFLKDLNFPNVKGFESRKCTFLNDRNLKKENFDQLIKEGLEFELNWLDLKKEIYSERSKEENMRISKIIKRIS